MTTLLAFLLTLAVLIVVHEYGHYLAARYCGVKVLRFSVGFGRVLYARQIGPDRTDFVLSAVPFGGYVKMLDEREAPVTEPELARAFNRQPVRKRILIVAAGPAANLLLAILLYWILLMSGMPGLRPILGEVEPGTPAAQASMKAGELIVRIGNTPVVTWQDVRWSLLKESLKSGSVEVEASSGSSETHLHQLDLSRIDPEYADTDLLKQLGLSLYRPALPARIGEIQPGSAAERAGLQPGDEVVAVNGISVALWEDFAGIMRQHPGMPVNLKLMRDGIEKNISITPDTVEEGDGKVGRIGAGFRMPAEELARLTVEVSHGPLPALWHAGVKTWETSVFSLKMLGNMVTGAVSWKGISGPITIASFAGQSASLGWKAFVGFLALVSISLGVLNLLPVPVLDGGHLMYYTIEILKGSPVSDHAMEIGQKIGFLLLGLLMSAAFYNDINRMISG